MTSVEDVLSRKYVNEEVYEQEFIRGQPANLVQKGMDRELNDLKEMDVFEWVVDDDIPKGVQTRCEHELS